MSNTVTLRSDLRLEFSAYAKINFDGSSKPLFKGSYVQRVTIKGGTIVAENAGVKAFAFTDSKSISIDGAKIQLVKGSNSNAFYCVDCINVYLTNINAKSATRLVDIKTESRVNDGHTSNIWIRNGVFDDASIEGVKVNYSRDVHIISNKVSRTYDNGIDIGWNSDSEIKYNRLTSVGLSDSAGIHTDSARYADVIGNTITTTGLTAI